MREKFLITILIVVIVVTGISFVTVTNISDLNENDYLVVNVQDEDSTFYSEKIMINDVAVEVQIADTPLKRNLGLMHQEQLPYDEGMLFIYENSGVYSFWMYNMKFALDIIWFDENGNVVHIEQNVPPCSSEPEDCELYDPVEEAMYVFEATAGFVEKFNLSEDSTFSWIMEDKNSWDVFRLKKDHSQ